MNFASHFPEDLLERYAMGRIPGPDRACLHEHLLQCSFCQINLEETIEYIAIMKAATAAFVHIPLKRGVLKRGMEPNGRVQAGDRMVEGALP